MADLTRHEPAPESRGGRPRSFEAVCDTLMAGLPAVSAPWWRRLVRWVL